MLPLRLRSHCIQWSDYPCTTIWIVGELVPCLQHNLNLVDPQYRHERLDHSVKSKYDQQPLLLGPYDFWVLVLYLFDIHIFQHHFPGHFGSVRTTYLVLLQNEGLDIADLCTNIWNVILIFLLKNISHIVNLKNVTLFQHYSYLICLRSPTKSKLKSFNRIKLSRYCPRKGLLVAHVIKRSRFVIAVTIEGEDNLWSKLISLVASAIKAFHRSRSRFSAAWVSDSK